MWKLSLLAATLLMPGLSLAQVDEGRRIQISLLAGEVEIRHPDRSIGEMPWLEPGSELNVTKGRVVLDAENHVRVEGEPGDRFTLERYQSGEDLGITVHAKSGAVVVQMGDARVLLPPDTTVVAIGEGGEGRIQVLKGPVAMAPSVLHEDESLVIDTQLGAFAEGDAVTVRIPEGPLRLPEAALFGDIAVIEPRPGVFIARAAVPADLRLAPAPLPASPPAEAASPLRWPGIDGIAPNPRFGMGPFLD